MRKQFDGILKPPVQSKLNDFKDFSEPRYCDDHDLESSPGSSLHTSSDTHLPVSKDPVELSDIDHSFRKEKAELEDTLSEVIPHAVIYEDDEIHRASSLPSLSSSDRTGSFDVSTLGLEDMPGASFRFNVAREELTTIADTESKSTIANDNNFDMEQSLDLFSNIPPTVTHAPQRPKRPKPPRPTNKPKVTQEVHPLMMEEPEASDEPMFPVAQEILPPPKPRQITLPKPADIPEIKSAPVPSSDSKSDDSRSIDRLSIPETRKASKRQKYRAIKESLISKASKAYNRYWYPKRDEEMKGTDIKQNVSDASDDSFYEIDTKEIEEIHNPDFSDDNVQHSLQPSSGFVSPATHTESEDNGEGVEVNVSWYRPMRRAGRPTSQTSISSITMFDILIEKYHNHIMSVVAVTASVVLYIIFFSKNRFLQGIITGITIPIAVLAAFWYLLKKEDTRNEASLSESAVNLHYSRLRCLGKKSSLKDFFQYTESQNFGDLKIKTLPYRYIKLKGTILEAYELNAAKDQVPNPTVLSHGEIKSFGLKLVFKVDISGWVVSVEPPSGVSVTPQNMWKKRYPIWVRRENWRPVSCDYLTDEPTEISSFFLFSPFSRYKELWYETLNAATGTITTDIKDGTAVNFNTEYRRDLLENYSVFMERLFDRIPHKNNNDDESGSDASTNSSEEEVNNKVKNSMRDVAWINALFGRFMWNILNDIKWDERIKDRIVRKLSSIQVSFISSVDLVNFNMGDSVPLITRTYLPKQDKQGTWSDMDLEWTGEVSMTLAVKFRTNQSNSSDSNKGFEQMSPETSTSVPSGSPAPSAGWVQTKLMKMIDKVEVSAKVTHLAGRVCVNIPPPPTDCLWYGFKSAPNFSIDIRPRIKGIDLSYQWLTKVLAKQLKILFEETFVLPSMENIVIPGMSRSISHDPTVANETSDMDLLDVAPRR